ncbi:MAG: HigA family addiction module antidote protein [Devosiaceae bacterium]|nr:HigA family addiction module antidote protein [Devosiaceae bacterium MH13]
MTKKAAIHPGVLLLEEFLKPLKISQNRLARDIDVPVSRIAALVAGDRAVTADTAMRLAEYFDTKPELWMNLQAAYELQSLRDGEWSEIRARIRPYDPTPTRRGRKPSPKVRTAGPAEGASSNEPVSLQGSLPPLLRSGTGQ